MMENTNSTDIKMFSTVGMHKSAIIYRDDSAHFIYVCFHCGGMFNNINDTLQHIESHFQLTNVIVDQFEDEKEDKVVDYPETTPFNPFTEGVEIKSEIVDNNEYDIFLTAKSEPINDIHDRDEFEAMDLKENPARSDQVPNVKRKKQSKGKEYLRPYKCHKCSRSYSINELRSHLKKYCNNDLLQLCRCKECDCYYRNRFELRIHVLEAHLMQKELYCNACSSEFDVSQTKQFEKHLNRHNGNNKNKLWTNIVAGIYVQSNDIKKFEEIDTFADQQHSCEFCSRQFYIKSNLDVHMERVHSGQRRLQCGQCESIFATPKYYFAHQMEHQRVGPNIVERDDNVLLANLDACVDERIVFENENEFSEQSYRCLHCNKKFESRHEIRSHVRKQHVYKMFPPPAAPKKEFICDLCGMRLKSKAAVKNHLLIHTNTKSHPCKICGKKFRQKSDRTIHERQHTGEKPYQCHQCGKGFISKGLLTTHQNRHDDRTYPCEKCGKVFNLPAQYRSHMERHREDRPFKCTICTKSFTTRRYLKKHVETHSGKQYQCHFCELKFSTGDGRRQHQRHRHQQATT